MAPLALLAFFELLITTAHSAIGPIGELHISNAMVAPDVFSRSAVVAEGSTPGPLIRGNKVRILDLVAEHTLIPFLTGRYFPNQCEERAHR